MLSNLPQRQVQIKTLTCLFIMTSAAAFSAGCASQKNDNANVMNSNTGMSNTNTSRTPELNKDILGLDDRPIIVSGGSVEIDFDDGVFRPDPQNDKKFISDGNKITAAALYDDFENANDDDYFFYDIPAGGITVVTITTKRQGDTEIIEIKDTPMKKVEMTFKTKVFKPRAASKKSRRRFDRKFKITNLEVKNNNKSVKCKNKNDMEVPCNIPNNGKFTFQIGTEQ